MRILTIAVAVIVAIFGLFGVFGAFYTIDEGERGVILRNGAIAGVAEPGLGFKVPFIDSVREISVQNRAKIYDAVEAYSRDQQLATLNISVTYHLPPDQVSQVYSQYGGEDGVLSRLVDRQVLESVKTIFGQFNAAAAIQERVRLNSEFFNSIQESIVGPVIIDSVQIEDVAFSEIYEDSIEARMLAEVQVQQRMQELAQQEVSAKITVTQAQAQADSQVAAAEAAAKSTILAGEAQAEITRLAGEAEAAAIRAKGDALRDNPNLVNLITAENWNGILPSTMLPGSAVPFVNVNGAALTP